MTRHKVFIHWSIWFYLNNVTNLHHLTLHSTTSRPTTWRSYRNHRLLWRHFTVSTASSGRTAYSLIKILSVLLRALHSFALTLQRADNPPNYNILKVKINDRSHALTADIKGFAVYFLIQYPRWWRMGVAVNVYHNIINNRRFAGNVYNWNYT